jgi:hypothetical protein
MNTQLEGFSVILRKDLPREEGRNPKAHYSTLIFAGIKNSNTSEI